MSFIIWAGALLGAAGLRQDAGETAVIAKALEYVYTRTFDRKFPQLKGRLFLPVDSSVPEGAATHTYLQWSAMGSAKIIANYADDLPRADAEAKEFSAPLRTIGDSYSYSIQDLRAAAMAASNGMIGINLDLQRAIAARRAIEVKIDDIIATGDAEYGLAGLVNNTNIPAVTLDYAPWDTATPLQVVADLNKLCGAVKTQTSETHVANTLLLDTHAYEWIAGTPMSSTGDSAMTILKFWQTTRETPVNVASWSKLNTAGSGSTTRAIAYERNEENASIIISIEFEQLPPQPRNLAFVVPCNARVGGVSMKYPLAFARADGAGA